MIRSHSLAALRALCLVVAAAGVGAACDAGSSTGGAGGAVPCEPFGNHPDEGTRCAEEGMVCTTNQGCGQICLVGCVKGRWDAAECSSISPTC